MKYYDEFEGYGSEFSEYVAVNVTLFVKAECFLDRSAENDDELLELKDEAKEYLFEDAEEQVEQMLTKKLNLKKFDDFEILDCELV